MLGQAQEMQHRWSSASPAQWSRPHRRARRHRKDERQQQVLSLKIDASAVSSLISILLARTC